MKKHSLKIVKIPSPSKQQLYRQEFIDQPINYLKIIENPDKIKIDQLTRDIDPKDIKTLDRKKLIYPNPEPYIPPAPTPVQENHKFDSPIKTTPPKPPRPVNNISKYKFDLPQDSDEEEDFELLQQPKENTIEVLTPPKPPESHYTPPPQHTTQQYTPPQNYKLTSTPQYTPIQTPQLTPRQTPQLTPQHTPQFTPQRNVTTPQQSIHARLHNFLTNHDSGDDSDNESNTSYTYRNKKVIDPYKYMSKNQQDFAKQQYEPPTLEELQRNGEYIAQPQFLQVQQLDELYNNEMGGDTMSTINHPAYDSGSMGIGGGMIEPDEESIDDKKRDLIINMALLKKKYPGQANTIPEINMQTPYNDMKSIYNLELKKLEIEYNVDNYRKYLIGGFMLIEYILGKFLRIDLEGFTQQQIINLQQYEVLLIELGEKKYMPDSKKWPVEVRLLFMIFIQAAIFTVSKLIMQRTGSNLLSMFNDAIPQQQTNKKKVKRPDINIDDL